MAIQQRFVIYYKWDKDDKYRPPEEVVDRWLSIGSLIDTMMPNEMEVGNYLVVEVPSDNHRSWFETHEDVTAYMCEVVKKQIDKYQKFVEDSAPSKVKAIKYWVKVKRPSTGEMAPIWEVWVERPGGLKSFMFNEKFGICHDDGPRAEPESPLIEVELDPRDADILATYIDNQDRIIESVMPSGEGQPEGYSYHQLFLDKIHEDREMIFSLEHYLIPPDKWDDTVPYDIQKFLSDAGPEGAGYHPIIGWFVLGGGQGPYLIWHQAEGFDKLRELNPEAFA